MKRIWSALAICLLVTTSFALIPSLAFAQQSPLSTDPVIHVDWHRNQMSDTDSWDSANTEWLFGQTLQLVITDENDTDIALKKYEVNRGDLLHFILMVPKAFFEQGDTELESATVGVDFYNETLSGGVWLDYCASRDEWYVHSAIHDMMNPPMNPKEFFDFTGGLVTEDSENLNVTYTGFFNASAPIGVYNTYAHVMDTANNFLYPSWFNLGYSGDMPMPPIALESTLDFHHGHMPPAEYDMRLLNATSLLPLRYAEAGDPLIFEMTMTEEIGFAAFWIGDISWANEYVIRTNVSYPDDYSNPDTTWTEWETWLYPKLGFYYNATTDIADAFVFYFNESYYWEDYGGGMGNWMYEQELVVNSSIRDDFIIFDPVSGDIDPFTVHWKFSLTDKVLEQFDGHYGGTLHLWAHNPNMLGTMTSMGVPGYPSMLFMEKDGIRFGYNDIIAEAFIQDPSTGDYRNQADPYQWLNISIDVYASNEVIDFYSDPYYDNMTFEWQRDLLELKNVSLWIYGHSWGWNETHDWHANIDIAVLIDVATLTPIGQFCRIVNETWLTRDCLLVSRVETNSSVGLSNLIEVQNFDITIGEKLTNMGLQMKFLNNAPDGDYFMNFQGFQNHTTFVNTTGSWEPIFWDMPMLDLGWRTQWIPHYLTLGTIWTYIPELWTVTEDGALDLDGDVESTTDDQYYIKRVYNWHDDRHWTDDSLFVNIMFDPTPMWDHEGDEFVSTSWMGLHTDSVTYTWNESFYWYLSNDISLVGPTEMNAIIDLVWLDPVEQVPAPGYHGIAWMTLNRTWDDIQNEWWWLDDNTFEFSWFGFDTTQSFEMAFDSNSTTRAHFFSAFSGLLLFSDNTTMGGNGVPDFYVSEGFVDSDEVTHYFLIDNVNGIDFTLPFDSTENEGHQTVSSFETIDFGVRIYDVNGTLFPTHTELGAGLKGCWDFYGSGSGLVGLNATAFDYMVSQATIDEIGFDVHFAVLLANTTANPDPHNNLVDIKVDQYIGDWTLHHFDNTVLEGRGLAISYFGSLGTDTYAEFHVDDKEVATNNEDTEIGDMYLFGTEGRTFAAVQMGGQLYDWGKDGQTYNCSAATVPMGAFSAMFQSETGKCVTHWEMESSYFFMLSGFTNWDGYSIDNDPSFGIYTSALNMIPPGGPLPELPDWLQFIGLIAMVGAIFVILIAVGVMSTRKRGSGSSKAPSKATEDYWADR
jgi:hypothetical protein